MSWYFIRLSAHFNPAGIQIFLKVRSVFLIPHYNVFNGGLPVELNAVIPRLDGGIHKELDAPIKSEHDTVMS